MEFGTGEVRASQTAGAVQLKAVNIVFNLQGSAKARPPGWVEKIDKNLHVAVGLLGGHVSSRRRQPQAVKIAIVKRKSNGKSAVNSRVRQHNHLTAHDILPFWAIRQIGNSWLMKARRRVRCARALPRGTSPPSATIAPDIPYTSLYRESLGKLDLDYTKSRSFFT